MLLHGLSRVNLKHSISGVGEDAEQGLHGNGNMKLGVYVDGFAPMPEMLRTVRCGRAGRRRQPPWFCAAHGIPGRVHQRRRNRAAHAEHSMTLGSDCDQSLLVPAAADGHVACEPCRACAGARIAFSAAVGNILNLAQSGITPDKPIRGDPASMSMRCGRCSRARSPAPMARSSASTALYMTFQHNVSIPIYIASTGPQMLRLAGEIGDGVVLWAGSYGLGHDAAVPCLRRGRGAPGAARLRQGGKGAAASSS